MTRSFGAAATGQPMVVLVGWLGCKPRHLQRYESLYKRLGFESSLIRIVSPFIIMECASFRQQQQQRTSKNHHHHHEDKLFDDDTFSSSAMDLFSWEIIKEIHNHNPSIVLFHAFSNAGCFTWERIRTILQHNYDDDSDATVVVKTARARIAGLIFDSGPVWYRPEFLFQAFDHCSWQDRINIRWQWMIHSSKAMTMDRAIHYWRSMRDYYYQDSSIFELYIYSKGDLQTNFDKLHELVSHRKAVLGKDRIFSRVFETSPHCGHILIQPDEYKATIQSFISTCLKIQRKSRL